ncbi:ferredoxin [Streptomyces humidus]|uniref:Ferredoxin n=1 Tax=Streptomyces humidus TaxID=52259 RepID=A0A918GDY1_9ACTN|nr:ferredoxin [Streptomyces humidus]GGS31680.1 ferredoxin [Streptomyces humidus]
MNAIEIEVDTDRCVGGGQCVIVAPEIFGQGDDGIVTVLRLPRPDEVAAVREAVVLCPGAVLALHGADEESAPDGG